jgi:hypothetical protein
MEFGRDLFGLLARKNKPYIKQQTKGGISRAEKFDRDAEFALRVAFLFEAEVHPEHVREVNKLTFGK